MKAQSEWKCLFLCRKQMKPLIIPGWWFSIPCITCVSHVSSWLIRHEYANWEEPWLKEWASKQSRFVFCCSCWHVDAVFFYQPEQGLCFLKHCLTITSQSDLHHQLHVITVWYGSIHFLSLQQHRPQQPRRKNVPLNLICVFFFCISVLVCTSGRWLRSLHRQILKWKIHQSAK